MTNNDARMERIRIFQDTMDMCKNKRLSDQIKQTVKNTVVYDENNYPTAENKCFDTTISVTMERSLECAARYRQNYQGKIGVHNFASATTPGGGVTNGSSAQEESLCRCSTLYPCLDTKRLYNEFYQLHRNKQDVRYSDRCIYTPDITVIKSDTAFPKPLPEEHWFTVDVLTCAAPNLRERPYNFMNPGNAVPIKVSEDELFKIHKKRALHLLTIAAANGVEILITGAFGCGAFKNDPAVTARAYKEAVSEFKGYFKYICFAVYCPPENTENYDIFSKILLDTDF